MERHELHPSNFHPAECRCLTCDGAEVLRIWREDRLPRIHERAIAPRPGAGRTPAQMKFSTVAVLWAAVGVLLIAALAAVFS